MLVDGRFDPAEFSEYEIEMDFQSFVEGVSALVAEHYATQFPTLEPDVISVEAGRSYWKIVKGRASGGGKSVYGFVRKADGAILKAATWKAPYTRGNNYVRGYVMQENALSAATPYGIIYQRG